MWTLFEPVHAVSYFAPEALSAFTDAGLRGFWRGYFAGRAAPLGTQAAEVVTASFYNFAPAFVARAIPGVWELISPEDALRVRAEGALTALRGLLPGQEQQVAAVADLLWQAASGLDGAGRVLASANAALPVPDDPFARLWQAATLFREHRGDGHFAALLAADIDGCEAVVLRCAKDLRRQDMQKVRGWTDEQWDAARARLSDRGWLTAAGELTEDGGERTADGKLTEVGRAAHAAVEDATDHAAARPWALIGPDVTVRIAEALRPIARACAVVRPARNPVGVPKPA
jgi:hypothetical protein